MSNTLNSSAMVAFHCVSYVDGLERSTPAGHRLSVVRWKTPSAELGNASYKKKPTIAVLLPIISLAVTPACLAATLTDALEEMQDAAVRSFVAARLEADSGIAIPSIVVPESLGTPEGVASFASAKAISQRMSTASLGEWFDAVVAGPLVDLVVSKLPPETVDAAEVAVAQVAKAKVAIVSLASPRSNMPPAVASQLARALGATVLPTDRTMVQVGKKLDMFINPPASAELLLNL